ncbi:MAG TPA: hypothetical protein VFS97_15120 [Nitrososphaeraceae archaeon]|nr:hypothetical protein [Nitrososphaeraceae archaeon]
MVRNIVEDASAAFFITKSIPCIIVLAFSGNSTNEYNQYLPVFEESVKTIKISKPGDIATSELYKKHKELETQTNQTIG